MFEFRTRSHCQQKSSTPEIKGAANPQIYHSNGLTILNLDHKGLRQNRESKAGFPLKQFAHC